MLFHNPVASESPELSYQLFPTFLCGCFLPQRDGGGSDMFSQVYPRVVGNQKGLRCCRNPTGSLRFQLGRLLSAVRSTSCGSLQPRLISRALSPWPLGSLLRQSTREVDKGSLAPKHSGSHPLHCASPVPAPSGKRLRLLWTDNWPARPEVGGAFRHRVAVYSKGWGVPPEPISPHWAGVSVLDDLSVGRSDCTSFCRRPPAPSSAGGRGGGGKSGSPGAAGAPAGAAVC
ncbi:uncharacterized protein ACOB8E_024819 isoform 1-T1 [Sarcophilus harrisii]